MIRHGRLRELPLRAGAGRRSGQSLVEFALVLPLLLIIVFGLIDFARAWSASHAVADAAREGLRMVVVHDPDIGVAEATLVIQERLWAASVDTTATTIAFSPMTEPVRGTPVTVTLDHTFDFLFIGPLLGWAAGMEEINLVSTYTMRAE